MVEASAERRREKLAWRIVLVSFAVFCVLLVAIPQAVGWYRQSSIITRPSTIQTIRGTVLFQQAGGRTEIGAGEGIKLNEGDQIRVASDSRAMLMLFDGSNLLLWPDTTVRIDRIRSSRYSGLQTEVLITQKTGQSRIEVAPSATQSRRFIVKTPQSSATLREGSYGLQVIDLKGEERTELSARIGSAGVSASDSAVEVLPGERTTVLAGKSPTRPFPAERNLIVNGDFRTSLEGWNSGNRNVEDGKTGEISIFTQEGRNIVRFLRPDSTRHAETFIHQSVEQDVSDYQSLRFTLQVKIQKQTLSGGGWLGSEYPLTVRVRYRDSAGNENTWVHGFFQQNDEGRPTPYGQKVRPEIWVPFRADLFDPNQLYPRPAKILWVELEGSGWSYDSLFTEVSLIGE